ncbi:MAG: hypothetical protein KF883_04925 [Thermomicrobiales bacterium]|nr:hypothetical protein [Thermomicrobiales bacterium]
MALLVDLVCYGATPLIIVLLAVTDDLTLTTALLSSGVIALIAALLGYTIAERDEYFSLSFRVSTEIVKSFWIYGRWLVASGLAMWASSQLYPVLAAGLVDIEAAGGLRASFMVFAPLLIVSRAFDAYFGPRAASSYQLNGTGSLNRLLKRVSVAVGIVSLMGCAIALPIAEGPAVSFLGSGFQDYGWLLLPAALSTGLAAFGSIADIGLRAVGKTRSIFAAYAIASVFALTAGVVLTQRYQLRGLAANVIVHGIILAGVKWGSYIRLMRPKFSESQQCQIPTP